MLRLSIHVLRTTLVIVFVAFGYVKFFAFEAEGVAPLIAAHPLLAWLAPTFGHAGAAAFLGVFEITAGVLLATRPFAPRLSALGGVMGMATFFVTVTLFWFVPGLFEASAGGFPAISGTGGFLLKDAVLFGASFVCLAESLDGVRVPRLSPARA